MSKKLTRTNRGTHVLIWIASILVLVGIAVYIFNSYFSIGLLLKVFPISSSASPGEQMIYGENIDMSQILPTSQHYIINSKGQDLIDIAANLGVNLIRITNGQHSFKSKTISIYTRDQWNQVLDKMQRKGIKAIIQIETTGDDPAYYSLKIQPAYLHLVQLYIDSGVFSHPDVYAVDIRNEPLITDDNLKMLETVHTMIKKKYPQLKQTVGWWAGPRSLKNPYTPNNIGWGYLSAGRRLANIVDFFSVHMYGLGTEHIGIGVNANLSAKTSLLQTLKGLQTKKPILIEEFGEANGDAISNQDTVGSPQLQANVYQGVYQALKEMHNSQILGTIGYDFHSRNQYPDAWAIVKDHGNYLFPAAYVLQEYALGKDNPSLQKATTVTSHSYLVANADNHTTEDLTVSDRIGLKLQLDSGQEYSLTLSANGILQPVTSLYYNPSSHAYEAVYQAINKGNVQIYVSSGNSCSAGGDCPAAIYTVTVDIQ